MKHILLIVIMVLEVPIVFAKDKIAPYVLDGAVVIYMVDVAQGVNLWSTIIKKTKTIEADNIKNRLSTQIAERMSVNIFDPKGAEYLGIDYSGGMAYVQLYSGVHYMIFTMTNERLLRTRLDTLVDPIPYRIEGNFVMFSSTPEILEYYNFQGITKLPEFNKIAKELSLSWDKNLIWMDPSVLRSQEVLKSTVKAMGDRIAGTFSVQNNRIILDTLTIYDDPQVNQRLGDSQKVSPVQNMVLLDYESGDPGIVGHTYVNFSNFVTMVQHIDQADYLSTLSILEQLKQNGVDIQQSILPYIKGRLSYVIRAMDPSKNIFRFTASSEIRDKIVLKQNINNIVQASQQKGITIKYKNLFTQQFYGWEFSDQTLWVGLVENHLIVSSDETDLINFVQNIYNARIGFINKLPISMRRLIANRTIGGQILFKNPAFIQNFRILDLFINYDLLVALKQVEWNFTLVQNPNISGRRDTIFIDFNE
ncbi:MAG: hypothetical protein ACRCWI_05825 [Brevinema sp.]